MLHHIQSLFLGGHRNKKGLKGITNMENKDWNPMDWQGRSKRQVETSETLAGISMIAVIVMVIGLVIYNAITQGI